jgi:O-antigen/teichoic acid export membrane protein
LFKLKKNFFYNSILAISQVLFPLITFPYVARILNPEGIGILTFVDSIGKYFILVAALGIPIYGIREIAKVKNSKGKLNQLFSELFLIHLVTTIVVTILYLLLIFSIEKLVAYKLFFIVIIPSILSNVFLIEWYFQGIEKFKYITTRTLIVRFLSTALIFIFINDSDDLLKYFIIVTILPLLNAVINFGFALKEISLNFVFNYKLTIKKHAKPLFFIFISMSFITVYSLLDTIILGFLSDNKSVGIYATAVKFSKIPIVFIGASSMVLVPRLSELSEVGNDFEFKKLIEKSIKYIYFISVPLLFITIGLSENIIIAFVGSDYNESIILLQFSSILTLLIGLSNIFGFQILTTLSQDKYFTLGVAIGTVSSLLLNFILVPYFDIYGALFTNIFSEILVTIVLYKFALKFRIFSINARYFFRLLFFSTPILLIIYLVKIEVDNNYLIIVFTSCLSLIYYFLVQLILFKDEILLDLILFLKNIIYGRI